MNSAKDKQSLAGRDWRERFDKKWASQTAEERMEEDMQHYKISMLIHNKYDKDLFLGPEAMKYNWNKIMFLEPPAICLHRTLKDLQIDASSEEFLGPDAKDKQTSIASRQTQTDRQTDKQAKSNKNRREGAGSNEAFGTGLI